METESSWSCFNSQPLIIILSHMNGVNILPFYILRVHFNIIIPSKPTHLKWILSFRFPNENSVRTSVSLIRNTYKAQPSAPYTMWKPLFLRNWYMDTLNLYKILIYLCTNQNTVRFHNGNLTCFTHGPISLRHTSFNDVCFQSKSFCRRDLQNLQGSARSSFTNEDRESGLWYNGHCFNVTQGDLPSGTLRTLSVWVRNRDLRTKYGYFQLNRNDRCAVSIISVLALISMKRTIGY